MRKTIFGTALLFAACYAAPEQMIETTGTNPVQQPQQPKPQDPLPEIPRIVCDMAKFSFTQDIGCMNDGWVEFCAEKTGAPVVTALRSISAEVQILEGHTGRAGCNVETEYLVSQPVQGADCMQQYGALTDSAWNTLCAFSQVPETKHFVPGFAE